MAQILTQTQRQEQRQQLSAQQVLVARLTELSVEELRAAIETECEANPWLERKDGPGEADGADLAEADGGNEAEGADTQEDSMDAYRESAADTADEADWGSDEFPAAYTEERNRREESEVLSFYDILMRQVGEYDLDEHQRTLLEYLIGSLDGDGLLRTPLYQIADELDINQGIRTTERELEAVWKILTEFEPYGVGARNLCECLLIQVRHMPDFPRRQQLITIFEDYKEEFERNHWDVIGRKMKLTEADVAAIRRAIQHLNPSPGGSVGRSLDDMAHFVVPDFKVQVNEYGEVQFRLCENGVPQLQLSEDSSDWLDVYAKEDEAALRQDVLDAIRYKRDLMERGKLFIQALVLRRNSLTSVMRAIIRLQEPFFREGDEALLRPMRMEDVAQATGLDVSTVSRVCKSKNVQTDVGTYPLRWFFTHSARKEGAELSVRHILSALKQLVEGEDKRHPYSDDDLTAALQQQGYDVARRTVAKYREQLGIPNSRMRR